MTTALPAVIRMHRWGEVEPGVMARLNGPDLNRARQAAETLAKFGSAQAEKALWDRLRKFHEQWSERVLSGFSASTDFSSHYAGLATITATAFGAATNVTRREYRMRRLVSMVEKKTVVRAMRSVPVWNTSRSSEQDSPARTSFEDRAWHSTRLSSDLKYRQISSKVEAKQLCLDDVAAGTSVQSGEQDDVRVQRSLWEGP
jgi:hypothetical protein